MGNPTPQISVNKLAEYLSTKSPSRRKQIIKDAKDPQKLKVTRYGDPKKALVEYLANNQDKKIIADAITGLQTKSATTSFQDNDKKNSILALESFEKMNPIDLKDCKIEIYKGNNEKVELSEINISVNPDAIIRKVKDGKKYIGGVKFHISKSFALNTESQESVGVILKIFLEKYVAEDDETVDPNLCFSLDIFNNSCLHAPKAFISRLKIVEAACEEIKNRWQTV